MLLEAGIWVQWVLAYSLAAASWFPCVLLVLLLESGHDACTHGDDMYARAGAAETLWPCLNDSRNILSIFRPYRAFREYQVIEQKWPQAIWVVRHGQSAGNVARDKAEAEALPFIDISTRDMDTPLSTLGEAQASALADWFRALPSEMRPTTLLSSPYVRAMQTSHIILNGAGMGAEGMRVRPDERLREKEFGILDRLTKAGIHQRYPELHEQRAHVGKFYFRPPGGESWCDVILRLRSLLDTLTRDYRRERVLIVAHQVIVNCMRYLLERLDETQILDIDRQADVPNCSVTSYEFNATQGRNGKLLLNLVNFVAPLENRGAPVTSEPDVPAAPKS